MSKLFARIAGLFSNRKLAGVDKAGNKYFIRNQDIDGSIKEKRWVVFKGVEEDPTSIPVEWICWLNGQRKKAPTPEEISELEERRERVRQNVALLKKEEEERQAMEAHQARRKKSAGKVQGPDLKSFIQQLKGNSDGDEVGRASFEKDELSVGEGKKPLQDKPEPQSSEPTGSGSTFRPGTWQPPT